MIKYIAVRNKHGEQHTYVLHMDKIMTIDILDEIEIGYEDRDDVRIPYQDQGITKKQLNEKLCDFLSEDNIKLMELWIQ